MSHKSLLFTLRYLGNLVGRRAMRPSFYLLGAQKSGTTSLFRHLAKHPCVLEPMGKEIHFFWENYHKGLAWYESWFPGAGTKKADCSGPCLTGDGSTGYLFEPHTPARLHSYTPDAKFVAILRNPIDRAFSAYQHEVRRRGETRSFNEVIQDELSWMDKEHQYVLDHPHTFSRKYHFRSHLRRGHYAEQLKRWFELFPPEHFLIMSGEEFFADPGAAYNKTVAFLGLPEHPMGEYKKHNVGGYNSEIAPDTLAFLQEYFAPLNEELYALLDVDYGW